MFDLEPPKPKNKGKFKKVDNRQYHEYDDEQKKIMKQELQEESGFDIVVLLAAAQLQGFKPSTVEESKQKQADAASVYLLSMFCTSQHSTVGTFAKFMALNAMMDSSNNQELDNKQKVKYGLGD